MNKKAQMMDKVFIFLLVLIVAAGIIFISLKIISSVLPRNQDVQLAGLKTELGDAFGGIEYGVKKELSIRTPVSVTNVCFFDNRPTGEKSANLNPYDIYSPKLNEMADLGDNTFFMNGENILGHSQIQGIRITDRIVKCFDASLGKLVVYSEGGDYGTIII